MIEALVTATYAFIFLLIQAIFIMVVANLVRFGEVMVSMASGNADRALDIIHELAVDEVK